MPTDALTSLDRCNLFSANHLRVGSQLEGWEEAIAEAIILWQPDHGLDLDLITTCGPSLSPPFSLYTLFSYFSM